MLHHVMTSIFKILDYLKKKKVLQVVLMHPHCENTASPWWRVSYLMGSRMQQRQRVADQVVTHQSAIFVRVFTSVHPPHQNSVHFFKLQYLKYSLLDLKICFWTIGCCFRHNLILLDFLQVLLCSCNTKLCFHFPENTFPSASPFRFCAEVWILMYFFVSNLFLYCMFSIQNM